MVWKSFLPLKTSTKVSRKPHGSSTKVPRKALESPTGGLMGIRPGIVRIGPRNMTRKTASSGSTTAVTRLAVENSQARAIGRGRRSQLYLWLRAHHDQLAESFAETGPAWSSIAAHLGNIGVVGGWGDPAAPETVRKAWYLVRRDVATARARRADPASERTVPGVAFIPPSAPSAPPPSAPTSAPDGDPYPRPRKFGLAGLRGHSPSVPPAATGARARADQSESGGSGADHRGHVERCAQEPLPTRQGRLSMTDRKTGTTGDVVSLLRPGLASKTTRKSGTAGLRSRSDG